MRSERNSYFETLEEYQRAEAMFHTELMNVCRKYVTKLNLVSMLGIVEISKDEIRELDKATKRNLDNDSSFDGFEESNENRYL